MRPKGRSIRAPVGFSHSVEQYDFSISLPAFGPYSAISRPPLYALLSGLELASFQVLYPSPRYAFLPSPRRSPGWARSIAGNRRGLSIPVSLVLLSVGTTLKARCIKIKDGINCRLLSYSRSEPADQSPHVV